METTLFHRHDFERLSAAETMLMEAIERAATCKSSDGTLLEPATAELLQLLTSTQAGRNYRFLQDELHHHQRRRRITRLFVG